MPLTGNLARFIKLVHENLTRMIGTYLGDSINMGTKKFEDESRITEHIYESKQR